MSAIANVRVIGDFGGVVKTLWISCHFGRSLVETHVANALTELSRDKWSDEAVVSAAIIAVMGRRDVNGLYVTDCHGPNAEVELMVNCPDQTVRITRPNQDDILAVFDDFLLRVRRQNFNPLPGMRVVVTNPLPVIPWDVPSSLYSTKRQPAGATGTIVSSHLTGWGLVWLVRPDGEGDQRIAAYARDELLPL